MQAAPPTQRNHPSITDARRWKLCSPSFHAGSSTKEQPLGLPTWRADKIPDYFPTAFAEPMFPASSRARMKALFAPGM